MKKFILLLFLLIGISSPIFSQSAGKGGSERSDSKRKPRKQMRHFDKQKKDKNLKHNGTSYRRNRKSKHKVDGDGFGESKQTGRRKRKKKSGIK